MVELHCTYDPETRGGNAPDGRKVRATLHWVSAAHAVEAEVRLYDHLFRTPDASDAKPADHFTQILNPRSLQVLTGCKLEPSLAAPPPGARYQFERRAISARIYGIDSVAPGLQPYGNVRDTWAKVQKAQNQ